AKAADKAGDGRTSPAKLPCARTNVIASTETANAIPRPRNPNQASAGWRTPRPRIWAQTAPIHTRKAAKPAAPIFAEISQSSLAAAVIPEVDATVTRPRSPTSVGTPIINREPGAYRP